MKTPKHPVAKLRDSSTFWLGMGALVLDTVAKRKGWPIDSSLLLALVGAYGAKELGANIGAGQSGMAETLATSVAGLVRPPERAPSKRSAPE